MAILDDFGLSSMDAFQQYVESPDADYLEQHPTARAEKLKLLIEEANTSDPEELMLIIMETFNQTVTPIPDVGKFYTFVYNAKTPNKQYDQHPLIACTSLEQWGFKAINFHWRQSRNYTWNELAGQLYIVNWVELDELLAIPYAKYILNR